MNEKEMNLAILAQLYDTAADTWAKMEKASKTVGNSYTAAEVWKSQGKEFIINSDECYTISVEGFSCSLTGETAFQMVDRFERLCRAGKNKRVFASMPEAARPAAEYCVTVVLNSSLADIASYAEKPDNIRYYALKNVCLDIEKKLIFATDGYRMRIKPLKVLSETGDAGQVSRVAMIKAAAWMRMCWKAKRGAELTCKLITEEDGGKVWVSECAGVTACTRLESKKNPYNVYSGIPPVSKSNVLSLPYGDWQSLRESIEAIKDENALITFRHDEGAKSIAITLEYQDKFNREITKEEVYQAKLTPAGRYCFTTKAHHVARLVDFDVFVPKNQETAIVHAIDGELTLIMPCITPDAYELETPDACDALELAGLSIWILLKK